MRITGMHKLTALDFPGTVSAIVFTQGCNFRCPYCHNPELIPDSPAATLMDKNGITAFLKKRAGLLDGLVISGGEPCLQPELEDFCRMVKDLGYRIKLDTNGSRPGRLEKLLRENLLDYVAMDCKTDPALYGKYFCREKNIEAKIRASVRLLRKSSVAYEFRTTCVSPFVTKATLDRIAAITGPSAWFLQKARLTGLRADVTQERVAVETMESWADEMNAHGCALSLRV